MPAKMDRPCEGSDLVMTAQTLQAAAIGTEQRCNALSSTSVLAV